MNASREHSQRPRHLETALLLVAILCVAAWLRFTGLGWGEGQPIHPDEEHMRAVTASIQTPDSLALYFDTARSPLNSFNRGMAYSYGTLPLFATRYAAEWLGRACGESPPFLASLVAELLLGQGAADCSPGAFTGSMVVGRALSALADLGTLLVLFLLGRRLYGAAVGLLAAGLGAFTVLHIQQAHFYTVESAACFFVVLSVYFAVRARQGVEGLRWSGWLSLGLAGLAAGLATACKISVAPVVGVAALAAVPADGRRWWRRLMAAVPHLAVVALLAVLAFRVAQPYAFDGPGFLGLHPNDVWLDRLSAIRAEQAGEIDTPPGQQWTNRAPLLFPWVNMVVWGMGLPLGLTAWAGWALAGVQLLRRRWQHLLPWAWATAIFLYQGTRWVKSIRYLLPVYPFFILLAAYLLVRLWCWGRHLSVLLSSLSHRLQRATGLVLPIFVVLTTILWALAFMHIYTHPVTRISASRWMYEHVPAAATLHYRAEGEAAQLQIPVPAGTVYTDGAPPVVTPFELDRPGVGAALTMNHLADPDHDPEAERFRVALAADPGGETILAQAETELPERAACTFPLGEVALAPDRTYYLLTQATAGGPVQAHTSIIANEHWDWGLPLRVDGRDAFGGIYQGLSTSSDGQMQLYNEDTLEKRALLFAWLDEADYIVLASNRLYGSIPRLPARYPLTVAYYQALFNGELGFELWAEFASFPALGPFEFPDQEEPFPVESGHRVLEPARWPVRLPPAEEAFSVYDHPRVLIFRKTPAYSRAQVEALLGDIPVERALVGQTPWQATQAPRDGLMLDEQTWAQQRAGGTWSRMFNRQGLLNRYPGLGAVAWWLAVEVLGWLAFPLLYVAARRLPDRGYGLARVLGLLVVAYLTWLAGSLRVLPHTRTTIGLAVLALALVGGGVGWLRRRELAQFLREQWRLLLVSEAIFAALYLAWLGVRFLNPDLWHPVVGGEKPMNFAHLNAVLKSTWFPPYDPWFAGGYINYYYFGSVLVGVLIKLLGIVPAIAYNLAVPLFFALTGAGAFSVAYNLAGGNWRRALAAGLVAVAFVLLLGNLGELRLIVNGLRQVGGEPFPSTIPGFAETVGALKGLWQVVVEGVPMPFRPESWYWEPTRIIPFGEGEVVPITEFPAFTFLYADLHAHMLALPLTLLALALALNWARGGYRLGSGWPASWLLGGLVIGSLRATNTWDWPTYLLLGLAGLGLGVLTQEGPSTTLRTGGGAGEPFAIRLRAFAWRAVLLVGLMVVLFLPYARHYATAYSSFSLWTGTRTPICIYLLMHGLFLFPVVTFLAVCVWDVVLRSGRELWREAGWAIIIGLGGLLLFTGLLVALGCQAAWMAGPVGVLAVTLIFEPDAGVERRVLWLLVTVALALTLLVELVVLEGDIGRMNTVFKFYVQVWVMLALAGAVSLVWLAERVRSWPPQLRRMWWGGMVGLIATTALFLPFSLSARFTDRFAPQTGATLDGMAYMEHASYGDVGQVFPLRGDYQAIRWMQDHILGSPVVVEAQTVEYHWGSRVAIYTGLPTVVGWGWHQVQQRSAVPGQVVDWRVQDVREFYNTSDLAVTRAFLERYEVGYVYVGEYERLLYTPEGLAKFDQMAAEGELRVVYDRDGVRIYEVVGW